MAFAPARQEESQGADESGPNGQGARGVSGPVLFRAKAVISHPPISLNAVRAQPPGQGNVATSN